MQRSITRSIFHNSIDGVCFKWGELTYCTADLKQTRFQRCHVQKVQTLNKRPQCRELQADGWVIGPWCRVGAVGAVLVPHSKAVIEVVESRTTGEKPRPGCTTISKVFEVGDDVIFSQSL